MKPFKDCVSSLEDDQCAREMGATNSSNWAFFFNSTCHYGTDESALIEKHQFFEENLPAVSPAEEFFE